MVIGLAGKSCSGKNSMGIILEKKGALHLDLDKTNHNLLDKYSREIGELFSSDLTSDDGSMNRAALSEIVFSRKSNLERLERFIHPKIEEETHRVIRENAGRIILLNGAALHKSKLAEELEGLIFMHSPFLIRLYRALARDHRSLGNILKRFRSQRKFNTQQFSSHVDIYKVYNGISHRALERRADKIYSRWISKGETL